MYRRIWRAGLSTVVAGLLVLPAGGQAASKTETAMEKPAPAQVQPTPAPSTAAPQRQMATARLQPTQGNKATGSVTFTRSPEGIEVSGELKGLAPGRHGIHIHEKGDCSAPDASSAGEHFNPRGTPHGAPENPAAKRHLGDLGNIEAGPDGSATYRRVDRLLTFDGTNSIIGKAVVVHAGPDDLTSQPSGQSGPRVACGIIEPTSR